MSLQDDVMSAMKVAMKEKNQTSHRGKAIQNMIILLQSRLPHIFHQMEDLA